MLGAYPAILYVNITSCPRLLPRNWMRVLTKIYEASFA